MRRVILGIHQLKTAPKPLLRSTFYSYNNTSILSTVKHPLSPTTTPAAASSYFSSAALLNMPTPKHPLRLYAHAIGPNPWKIELLLAELGISYEPEYVPRDNTHTEEYLAINPNGRVPTIIDPNNSDLKIWESGAIIEYLLDKYDSDSKLQPTLESDRWHARQWLFFQVAGQGPYFGQYVWFKWSHPEQLPSAQDRYLKEIHRMTALLDQELKNSGKDWLVGDKFTYADLALLPWFYTMEQPFPELFSELASKYPHWRAWQDRILARPAIKKILEKRLDVIATVKH